MGARVLRRFGAVVVAIGMTIGFAAGPAQANGGVQAKFNDFASALMTSSEADPWPLECTGGPNASEIFYFPILATKGADCTVGAHVPLLIVPAAVICWTDEVTTNAKRECRQVWTSDPLVSASVKIDGQRVRLEERHSAGTVHFPKRSLLGAQAGTTETYYQILRGAVVDGLTRGVHTVVLAFEYEGGFKGRTTFTVKVV